MGLSVYAMLRLADGGEKRVDEVGGGDALANPLTGAAMIARDIASGPAVGMFQIVAENGAQLDLTGDSLIFTEAGPARANQVRPGTVLQTAGGLLACREAQPLPGDFMVYDIAVRRDGQALPCIAANGFFVGV